MVKSVDEEDDDEMSLVNESFVATINVSAMLQLSDNDDRYLYSPGAPPRAARHPERRRPNLPRRCL
jgi:hypothetical protein